MAINLGNTAVKDVYLGNTQVKNVYLGNALIYSAKLLSLFPMTTGAAYSLRQLNNSLLNVVRIRRSSDNSESDFSATQITNGTLLTFCGSGSGFVTTWYDQSGNNAHVTQTTAGNQPSLVVNGVINLESGKPTIVFNGTTNFLSFNGEVLNKNSFVAFAVVKNNKTTARGRIFDQSNNNGGALFYTTSALGGDSLLGIVPPSNISINSVPPTTAYSLQVGQVLSGNSKLRNNGTTLGTNTTTFTMSGDTNIAFVIGDNSPAGADPFLGNLQALIIYTTDNDSNILGIETAINNIYNIY